MDTRVRLEMHHETGEGSMFIEPHATTAEVNAAVREQVEAAGWQTIDAEESGDLYEIDDAGRMVVPLFMPGHPALG